MVQQPKHYLGSLAVDDRGEVGFVNEFDFIGVKRFYTVSNHKANFVRAWHGHKEEAKYVTVLQGAALVAAVPVHDWEHPDPKELVQRFTLSAHKPSILYIPSGYCNGFMSLSADTKLIFFSTSTLEQSKNDDIRLDARFWDVWQVEER